MFGKHPRNTAYRLKLSYPMFHADRIKTPTLFLSGLKDFNYPGQAHGITMPSYARDRLARYVAWFDKYLKK